MAWHIYCICFNIRTDEWVSSLMIVALKQRGEIFIPRKRYREIVFFLCLLTKKGKISPSVK